MLHTEQPVPDNYSEFDPVCARDDRLQAATVGREIAVNASVVATYVVVWRELQRGKFGSGPLLLVSAALAADQAWAGRAQLTGRKFFQLGYVLCTVSVLAPFLRTLTQSWSEDTVLLVTAGLLVLHLVAHPYAGSCGSFSPISMNAAFCSGVLLTSRLPSDSGTDTHAIAFFVFTLAVFSRSQRGDHDTTRGGWEGQRYVHLV